MRWNYSLFIRPVFLNPFPDFTIFVSKSAIIRGKKLIFPRGNIILKPGDEVLAVMHESVIEQVRQIIQEPLST